MSNSNKYKLREPQLEAEIYYLTEQEGGRKTAVNNGYRGQFHYNGKDWDAPQQFIDKETCNLGETVKVYLQTLSPDFHIGHFFVGQEFETREGSKIVGKGKITRIIRPDFNYWNGSTFLKTLDKNIKPYSDTNDFLKIRTDLESWLTNTSIIKNIEFEITGNLECMILIKCKLINKNLQPREVAHKIIEGWKTNLIPSNQLYKIEMNTSFDWNKNQLQTDKFILSFATWHSIFLTGQIIVKR
ncbi:hypothetical protein LPB87_00275 [Flavobacterium sp. EDS]|uniref:EF-Tu C-terminal domain-related protein n=1 Tax=Flavobacterium sp. EDS TaxID=2897328 RepID=UPI001E568B6D|nr:hypothetical protein [Flavobacterium sp. EDS]MCD0472824.1 hypothetical protein [Flavobacterium sp. EDS]